jgi:hypothetical protein
MQVQVIGADTLRTGLGRAQKGTTGEAKRAMETACLAVEGVMRPLMPRDTGQLQGSVTHTVSGGGTTIRGEVGPTAAHALYAHQGRRPGRPPPGRALEGWARRHGMNPYALARAIGRKGTKGKPWIPQTAAASRGKVEQAFAQWGQRVVALIVGG